MLRSIAIALLMLASVIHAEDLFKATALTAEGSFTSGVEGPACDRAGNLFAVSFSEERTIGRISPDGKGEVFIKLPDGSTGNGIRFDRAGLMYVADYTGHNILRIDPLTKAITTFAHNAAMSQPNDIAITDDDVLYASDPNWKGKPGQIWRIDTKGDVSLAAQEMGTTNGIEVSPDNKHLYVNESLQRQVWSFDIAKDGSLTNKKLIKQFADFGFDGMRCDVQGNLYIARHGKGTVIKMTPAGEILQEVAVLGSMPSNVCFGGSDGRTVYVTEVEKRRIVQFRVDQPGREWQLQQATK